MISECYDWILHHETFLRWRDDDAGSARMLWMRGDPGKGKTMLVCGIINHLLEKYDKSYVVGYFFCQATQDHVNSAHAVLRGLIYSMLRQCSRESHSLLMKKLVDMYGNADENVFRDVNSWEALIKALNVCTEVIGTDKITY